MNCNNHITGSLPVHTMYTTDRLILKILTPDDTNEVLAFQCRNRELFAVSYTHLTLPTN